MQGHSFEKDFPASFQKMPLLGLGIFMHLKLTLNKLIVKTILSGFIMSLLWVTSIPIPKKNNLFFLWKLVIEICKK